MRNFFATSAVRGCPPRHPLTVAGMTMAAGSFRTRRSCDRYSVGANSSKSTQIMSSVCVSYRATHQSYAVVWRTKAMQGRTLSPSRPRRAPRTQPSATIRRDRPRRPTCPGGARSARAFPGAGRNRHLLSYGVRPYGPGAISTDLYRGSGTLSGVEFRRHSEHQASWWRAVQPAAHRKIPGRALPGYCFRVA